MIEAIRKLIKPKTDKPQSSPSDINLAAAALLIEVMVIDHATAPEEETTIKKLLKEQLGLMPTDIEILFNTAKEEVTHATSLFQFTRQINDQFSQQQKFELVVQLWKVAYADGNLDKYEEHLIRRISELIHLPHSEFIRAKSQEL